MCKLCGPKKVIVTETGFGAVFHPCPNCKTGTDLTPVIKRLERMVQDAKRGLMHVCKYIKWLFACCSGQNG